VSALALCRCDNSPEFVVPRAPADAIPPSAEVAATTGTVGFAIGRLRSEQTLEAFRISRSPTSVGQYRRCVEAGACTAPAQATLQCLSTGKGPVLQAATWGGRDTEELPVTCVQPEQAKAYCRWVGGVLPTTEQWMIAARGPAVRRYAWGDDPPGVVERSNDTPDVSPSNAVTEPSSPFGLVDVLRTQGELVAASDMSASPPSCYGDNASCAITGLLPFAIDHLLPVVPDATNQVTYGFRCTWKGDAR
jgi:hypothetical protein